jgi:hypothetical protein
MPGMTQPSDSRPELRWRRGFFVLLILGATLGSALDGIHTHFGATAYTSPLWWRMAWWTPLLFGGAFAIGMLHPFVTHRFGAQHAQPAPPRPGQVALAFALFVLAYFLTVAPLSWPFICALLFGIFAAGFWLCDRTPIGLGIALTAAAFGPLVEWCLVSLGTFAHLRPLWLGLPGWLPFLYLTAAVAMMTLARWLVWVRVPRQTQKIN